MSNANRVEIEVYEVDHRPARALADYFQAALKAACLGEIDGNGGEIALVIGPMHDGSDKRPAIRVDVAKAVAAGATAQDVRVVLSEFAARSDAQAIALCRVIEADDATPPMDKGKAIAHGVPWDEIRAACGGRDPLPTDTAVVMHLEMLASDVVAVSFGVVADGKIAGVPAFWKEKVRTSMFDARVIGSLSEMEA